MRFIGEGVKNCLKQIKHSVNSVPATNPFTGSEIERDCTFILKLNYYFLHIPFFY